MWEHSVLEQQSGVLGPLCSKNDFDQEFWVSQWRAMVRFALWQENKRKFRLIDNGRSSDHNATHESSERIHTTSTETGMAVVRHIRTFLTEQGTTDEIWRGTADLLSAYRQVPIHPSHQRFHVVAIWHPEQQGWRFAKLFGLCF